MVSSHFLVYAFVPCIPYALAALVLCAPDFSNQCCLFSKLLLHLKNAREAALKDWNYNSEETRQMMSQKLMDIFNRRSPYDWQLNAAELLILGLDCVVVAGTGTGKTIPFMLPLFVHDSRDKLVLIISPLNALEMDQVSFSLTVPALYSIFTDMLF